MSTIATATEAPRREIRALQKALRMENRSWPDRMREVPMSDWTDGMKAMAVSLTSTSAPMRAWRSNRFVAVLYDEGIKKPNRLSINRAVLSDDGRYEGGITWDELMQVKRECGFEKVDALELFPSDATVVDVQNMRHLWICDVRSRLNWNR